MHHKTLTIEDCVINMKRAFNMNHKALTIEGCITMNEAGKSVILHNGVIAGEEVIMNKKTVAGVADDEADLEIDSAVDFSEADYIKNQISQQVMAIDNIRALKYILACAKKCRELVIN